jgi:hypothetical protein
MISLHFLQYADLFSVIQCFGFRSHGFDAFVAHQHYVGPVNGRFTLKNPPLPILRIGFRMPLDNVDVFYEQAILLTNDLENLADLALVFAGDDLDLVIFFDIYGVAYHFVSPRSKGTGLKNLWCK